jgi:acid phosphatase family membrane protein YuiD
MVYVIFPFVVWTISQTIKFAARIIRQDVPKKLRSAFWTYVWAAGPPSTHSAILSSALVLVWDRVGPTPTFTFCLAVTMLWLFDMVSERKKQETENEYFGHDTLAMRKAVRDGTLIDLSGHSFPEVVLGILLGTTLGVIFVVWIMPHFPY